MQHPHIPQSAARALSSQRRAALESFYGALALKQPDLVDLALTGDWEDIPMAPNQEPGPAGIKAIFATLSAAFPDLTVRIVDALAEENRAAVRVECTGTHQGALFGVPASGKAISFSLHEFHEFDGDRIKRTWHMEDLFGLFAQIGTWPNQTSEAA
ncbi:ester cyclase [Paracoccus aminophilus]|nr:ester cyclase [Paracoccus aminophilus]